MVRNGSLGQKQYALDRATRPEATALLVVDVQNDFCSEGGSIARAGGDLSHYQEMISAIRVLLDAARGVGVLIVYLQHTMFEDGRTDSPVELRFRARLTSHYSGRQGSPIKYAVVGTWGHEIVDSIRPVPGDLVVPKYRSSGFVGTPLNLILKQAGRSSVVIVGCTTEGCVDSTARDAGFHEYHPLIPEDCVASDNEELHKASLLILRSYRAEVVKARDLIALWTDK